MNDKKSDYLTLLEITRYIPRKPASKTNDLLDSSFKIWQVIENKVKNCHHCALCQTRKNTVFGIGNRKTDLMLIGEAPGATEDEQGEPFVGAAGLLLNKMLAAIGQSRHTVFITNILKCRPPNNRDPLPLEVTECFPYLLKQIELIRPKLILALGRVAAQNLLNTKIPLGKLREQTFQWGEYHIPLVVTYHPAYLLRNPADKRNAWIDLQRVQNLLK